MVPRTVLFLTPLVAVGGEEASSLSLAREFVKRGYRVLVKGDPGPLHQEFVSAGAKFCPSSRAYERSVCGVMSDARDIRAIMDSERIDIIHAQSVLPAISACMALRRPGEGSRPPLIFHHRGLHDYSYPVVGRLGKSFVDCVIVNSEYEKKRLLKNGLNEGSLRTIYNCINIDFPEDLESDGSILAELGLDPDVRIIGTVGRLVKEKGLRFMIEAFKKVSGLFPLAYLLIVGDGVLRVDLEKFVKALGVADKVIFTGVRRDLWKVYGSMEIFAMSSVFESFGNVALEAAAYGKPVIATNVGGLPEAVVNGRTGILVPPGDSDKLAEAMTDLLDDKDKAARMGKAGRERVRKHFVPERVADEVQAVYERLLQRN